jgi:hypothetical protein
MFNLDKNEAKFLAADFDNLVDIPDTPIPSEEYGLSVIHELQQNKPWFTNDMLNDAEVTEMDKRLAYENGIHTWLSLPLLYQEQLIGALNLGAAPGVHSHKKTRKSRTTLPINLQLHCNRQIYTMLCRMN